jgi:hypothetical protein
MGGAARMKSAGFRKKLAISCNIIALVSLTNCATTQIQNKNPLQNKEPIVETRTKGTIAFSGKNAPEGLEILDSLQIGEKRVLVESGKTVHAVALIKNNDFTGMLTLETMHVDKHGVKFEALLIIEDQVIKSTFRVDFDGRRSGDISSIEFFGGEDFRLEKNENGIYVIFRETIDRGIEKGMERPGCPVFNAPGVACT